MLLKTKKYSSLPRYFFRRIISFLLYYSPSENFSDILLWPVSKRLLGKNYWEIVSVTKNLSMYVYGCMEDMVNKTLMHMSVVKDMAWEPVTARLVMELSKNSKCVVVAGAHIGYYPLIVAKNNPLACVYAFEPNPENFEALNKNTIINNLSNIKTLNIALGDFCGEKKMYFDFGQSSFVDSSREHSGAGLVSVLTIDSVFEKENKNPDLIILDAEGFELEILRGGESLIEKNRPNIIFELNPRALKSAGHVPDDVYKFLANFGYSIFLIKDDYEHSLNIKSGVEIGLLKYSPRFLENVSFLNAFATINPNRFAEYVENNEH